MKQNIIIFIITLTVLLTVLYLVFDIHKEGEKKTLAMFHEHELNEVHQIAHKIETYLESMSENMPVLAAELAENGCDPERMPSDIKTYFAYLPCMFLKSVSICDESGKVVYSTNRSLDSKDFSGYDFLNWTKQAPNRDKIFISHKAYSKNHSASFYGIDFAAALYKKTAEGGGYIGAVIVTIDASKMFAEQLTFPEHKEGKQRIWIVDSAGTVLYHSGQPEMALKNIYSNNGCGKCHDSFEQTKECLLKKEGQSEFIRKSGKSLVAYATTDIANISWSVIADVPYSEIEAVTKSNLRNTFLLIGVFAFVIIGGFVFIFRNNVLKVKAEEHAKQLTEKLRLEEKLSRSEERYKRLFEESPNAVFISTPEGKLIDINSAGVGLFGYASKEEMQKVNIARDIYCVSGDRDRFMSLLEKQGFSKDYELALKHKNGHKMIALLTVTAIRGNSGKITEIRGIMQDITERRRFEQHLLHSQKMESIYKLAGGIAHDFNNIMGIILGYALLLEQEKNDPEKFSQDINAITKAVQRGTTLTRQILAFAKKADTVFEPVDVNEIIYEITAIIAATFPRTITLSVQADKNVPPIIADYNQIYQALLNLSFNARDAMMDSGAEGGTLTFVIKTVSGAEKNSYIAVSVSDTGIGMDENLKSRIFEPFFTTKEMRQGTGLGLAVVYGIVQVHGGFIDVYSKPGHGSIFTIYLPVADNIQASTIAIKVDKLAVTGGTETVLVVEDEESLLRLLRIILERKGYKVLTAGDGREAVDIYTRHMEEIDMVLTDMGMPKLDGAGLISVLKTLNPGLKVVIASGYFEIDLKSRLLELGVKDFIQKPYVLDDVLKRVRRTLDNEK